MRDTIAFKHCYAEEERERERDRDRKGERECVFVCEREARK